MKSSDQTYSIGAFLGKDPEDVKQQKHEKLGQQITDVGFHKHYQQLFQSCDRL